MPKPAKALQPYSDHPSKIEACQCLHCGLWYYDSSVWLGNVDEEEKLARVKAAKCCPQATHETVMVVQ